MPQRGAWFRIVLPVGVMLVLLEVLFAALGYREMRSAVQTVARARARATSELAMETIEARMRSGHQSGLARTFDRLAHDPDVATLRVLDAQGRVLISSRVKDAPVLAEHAVQRSSDGDTMIDPATGTIVHRVTTIFAHGTCRECHHEPGGVIGLLDVDITTARQTSGLRMWAGLNSAAGLLQVTGSLVAIGLAVTVLILRPLRRLTGLMDRVRAGDLSVAMESVSTREIDDVGRGFNAMVHQLRAGAAAADEARRLELERAEHLSAVGRLASGLAHEIRNPLSGVKAALEVLRSDMSDGEPREIVSESLGELSRIDAVVRDLLSYARPSPPLLRPVDLNAVITDSMVLLEPLAWGREVSLRRDLAPGLPPVIADSDMLHRLVVNLAMNAIDAVRPPGHVTFTTALRDGRVVCRIRDSGPGVPLAIAARLFEPFFTTKTRGTGLGLAISRRLVENFDGKLWLENPGEGGASFAFSLPVTAAAEV